MSTSPACAQVTIFLPACLVLYSCAPSVTLSSSRPVLIIIQAAATIMMKRKKVSHLCHSLSILVRVVERRMYVSGYLWYWMIILYSFPGEDHKHSVSLRDHRQHRTGQLLRCHGQGVRQQKHQCEYYYLVFDQYSAAAEMWSRAMRKHTVRPNLFCR
jgi:hypothetical protein